LLQKVVPFLDRAHELTRLFEPRRETKEIQPIASHHLMTFVLVDVVRDFRENYPDYNLRLSTRAEAQVISMRLSESHGAIGACTPTDFPRGLQHHPGVMSTGVWRCRAHIAGQTRAQYC